MRRLELTKNRAVLLLKGGGALFGGELAPLARGEFAEKKAADAHADRAEGGDADRGRRAGDLAQLGETFNRMTYELRTQRDDLMRARDVIDQRRRFTEAVQAGASAGVIGVDADGRITILNRSAEKLIDRLEADVIGVALVAKAGYDPYGASRFLQTMDRNAALRTPTQAAAGRPLANQCSRTLAASAAM